MSSTSSNLAERYGTSLSIVIPTYNSSEYLARLLHSIDQAEKSFGPIEVLIVDDSRPHEAQTICALCNMHGATYLECKGNVSLKRNFGVAHAMHDVILFVDSDCEVTPELLAEHARLASQPDDVGAMLGIVEFVGDDTFMWRVIERSQFLGPYSFARRMEYAPWGGSGNLSVKKTAFNAVGGFDAEWRKVPGGEDVDFGLRLNKSGYKVKCNPAAVVNHTRETWSSFRRMVPRVFNYGRNHYLVLIKHRDKTGEEYPRLATVFVLFALITFIRATATLSLMGLGIWPVYVVGVMLVQAILTMSRSQQPASTLGIEVVAHTLDLVFDFGILTESVLRRSLIGFHRKMIYAKGQLFAERDRKVIQAWSLMAGFLPILLFL